jgi:hypothetical protein
MLSHRAKGGKEQTKNCPSPFTAKVAVFVNVCCEQSLYEGDFNKLSGPVQECSLSDCAFVTLES